VICIPHNGDAAFFKSQMRQVFLQTGSQDDTASKIEKV
jgi:hypothetical protein